MLTTGRGRAVATLAAAGIATLTAQVAALRPGAAAVGPPLTQAPCPAVTASISVFRPGGVPYKDWREELAFDGHGGMWGSPIQDNRLERYDAAGNVTETV